MFDIITARLYEQYYLLTTYKNKGHAPNMRPGKGDPPSRNDTR